MYYYEIRHKKERFGKPVLVAEDKLCLATGFRSVYGFDKETADRIISSRSSAGLKGKAVYADVLLIDFDDEYEEADKLRESLVERGIGFSTFNSGNRSIHFHIPHPPVFQPWLPKAHKQWIAANCPKADVSFYHPAGLFRLPLTIHEKTGKLKVEIETHQGEMIELTEPVKQKSSFRPVDLDTKSKAALKHRLFLNLTKRVGSGGRSMHISCMLARDCAKLGMSEIEALNIISKWNSNFAEPPHSVDTLEAKIEYEYRKFTTLE